MDENGLCAGAFYRSIEYLNIKPNERTGKKKFDQQFKRVHIEHSVPISEIYSLLIKRQQELESPKDIFSLIINYSICTGFSQNDERNGIRKGFSRKLTTSNLSNRSSIMPFQRYNENVEIRNILDGSIASHNQPLNKLTNVYHGLKIFDWEFIEEHYTTNER